MFGGEQTRHKVAKCWVNGNRLWQVNRFIDWASYSELAQFLYPHRQFVIGIDITSVKEGEVHVFGLPVQSSEVIVGVHNRSQSGLRQ